MQPDELAALTRSAKRRPIWTPGPATRATGLGRSAIERLIPHRDPFLFVDRITAVDLEQVAATGLRRIDPNDPVFAGHFPAAPIYPGVLGLETMGQLGCCLVSLARLGTTEVPAFAQPTDVRALKVLGANFFAEVRPGDELTISAKLVEEDSYGAVCSGQLTRGDTIVSFAVMEVYLVEA